MQLRRVLGLTDLVFFNIAALIGIRWLAAAAQAGPGSITLWLLAAAFFFMPSALAVAGLSVRYPEEGGIYVWTKKEFGEWHGFLCGWCYWLSNLFYFPHLLVAGVGMAGYALGLAESKGYILASRWPCCGWCCWPTWAGFRWRAGPTAPEPWQAAWAAR